LSNYYLGTPSVSGLVLGYGHLDPASIRSGVDRLAAAIRKADSPREHIR
jgi:DNA-binding transcriptional MocR family regulator